MPKIFVALSVLAAPLAAHATSLVAEAAAPTLGEGALLALCSALPLLGAWSLRHRINGQR